MAVDRKARILRRCRSQVSAMVNKRAVASSPSALRLPNEILRHGTPVRSARSALWLVGSTPARSRKVYRTVVMLEQGHREIRDLAMGTVQVPLGQGQKPFLDLNGTIQQLLPVDQAPAELMPEPEKPGMLGQRVPAKLLHDAALGKLRNSQQIAFEMRPAELGRARVILQVRAETVAAQDTLEDGAEQTDQHFAAAGCSHTMYRAATKAHRKRLSPLVRQPVSSIFKTGSSFNCRSNSWQGAATASLASSQHFCVLPKLISIPRTCASSASTTRRGIRQTTVRYAISAVS